LDNLPSTLENLFLLSEYTNSLMNLPSGLNFLHLNSHANINIKLPKNIKYVQYPEDNNWLRRKLLKSNPNVIYNYKTYKNKIEMYDEKKQFYNNNMNLNTNLDSDLDSDVEQDDINNIH
jgi:hypothetical protein